MNKIIKAWVMMQAFLILKFLTITMAKSIKIPQVSKNKYLCHHKNPSLRPLKSMLVQSFDKTKEKRNPNFMKKFKSKFYFILI